MFNFRFDKRKIIILSLVFVLFSVSYLNYMINKQSLLETSTDFKNYEEKQLSIIEGGEDRDPSIVVHEIISEDNVEATSSIALIDENEAEVVDSQSTEIDDIITVANDNIEKAVFNEENSKSNYFLQAKIDIEVEREKTIERFDEIINNEHIDEQSRKSAVNKKISLIDIINKEKIMESLIKSKGFEDVIVFVTDQSIYVTVSADDLNDSDIAKILDIVTREGEVAIDNVKIQRK